MVRLVQMKFAAGNGLAVDLSGKHAFRIKSAGPLNVCRRSAFLAQLRRVDAGQSYPDFLNKQRISVDHGDIVDDVRCSGFQRLAKQKNREKRDSEPAASARHESTL